MTKLGNVRLHYDIAYGAYRLYIYEEKDKSKLVLTEDGMLEVFEGHAFEGILIDERSPLLQNLMEELWNNGIRPREEQIETKAKDAHLKDMRVLVSKILKVKL